MAKVRKDGNGSGRSDAKEKLDEAVKVCGSLGGVFGKFGNLIETLGELAEKGESLSKSGELKGLDPKGKLRGVYGVSIKSGLSPKGEEEFKVEPFGNVHRKPKGGTVVDDTREPLVDVHEEDDHVLVIAELPGVSKKDIQVSLSGEELSIKAQRGAQRYEKEVELPEEFSDEKMRWTCNNGILKIRLERS